MRFLKVTSKYIGRVLTEALAGVILLHSDVTCRATQATTDLSKRIVSCEYTPAGGAIIEATVLARQ